MEACLPGTFRQLLGFLFELGGLCGVLRLPPTRLLSVELREGVVPKRGVFALGQVVDDP